MINIAGGDQLVTGMRDRWRVGSRHSSWQLAQVQIVGEAVNHKSPHRIPYEAHEDLDLSVPKRTSISPSGSPFGTGNVVSDFCTS